MARYYDVMLTSCWGKYGYKENQIITFKHVEKNIYVSQGDGAIIYWHKSDSHPAFKVILESEAQYIQVPEKNGIEFKGSANTNIKIRHRKCKGGVVLGGEINDMPKYAYEAAFAYRRCYMEPGKIKVKPNGKTGFGGKAKIKLDLTKRRDK